MADSITSPDLADRVADDCYVKRLSLNAAAQSPLLGNRAELGRWRPEVRKGLAESRGFGCVACALRIAKVT